jgi:hypothetical protein
MWICLDSKISNDVIKKIEEIEDVYFVRNVKRLEA